jgi:hypothetical protein
VSLIYVIITIGMENVAHVIPSESEDSLDVVVPEPVVLEKPKGQRGRKKTTPAVAINAPDDFDIQPLIQLFQFKCEVGPIAKTAKINPYATYATARAEFLRKMDVLPSKQEGFQLAYRFNDAKAADKYSYLDGETDFEDMMTELRNSFKPKPGGKRSTKEKVPVSIISTKVCPPPPDTAEIYN